MGDGPGTGRADVLIDADADRWEWHGRSIATGEGCCGGAATNVHPNGHDNKKGRSVERPFFAITSDAHYASKYMWNSCGCGRMRIGSISFSYL